MDSARTYRDGVAAGGDELQALALASYGHFTSLQLRGGRAPGIDLHLRRLREANRELFGAGLDAEAVRGAVRAALAADGAADCSLRLVVHAPGYDPASPDAAEPRLLVTVSPPADPPTGLVRVKSFRYERVAPHLKHLGTFPLRWHRRLAAQAGFDDALFVDGNGRVSEGSTWNVGFLDGQRVVWPQAPVLRGTQVQLLQAGLDALGVPQEVGKLRLEALDGFSGAFACNSRGSWLLAGLDGIDWRPDPAAVGLLARALAVHPSEAF